MPGPSNGWLVGMWASPGGFFESIILNGEWTRKWGVLIFSDILQLPFFLFNLGTSKLAFHHEKFEFSQKA